MASVEKRARNGKTVRRAHYRTPNGAQRNKSFARKVDAERFLTTVESAKLSGSYVDPALGRVGEWVRRRAVIAESVTLVGSVQVFGTPKAHQRREVPIPAFLADEFQAHVTGRDPGELAFAGVRGGGPLRAPVFRRPGTALGASLSSRTPPAVRPVRGFILSG
jgi:hypothetical protein